MCALQVPGEAVEVVTKVIEEELGPMHELFESFEPEPCGAASIGIHLFL